MANERGHYGKNGVPYIGAAVPAHPQTIYVAQEHSSVLTWLIGGLAIGGAFLWARHQTKQIEQIAKTSGAPYQSFTSSLREDVRALPSRARETYHDIAERIRPSRKPARSPALPSMHEGED